VDLPEGIGPDARGLAVLYGLPFAIVGAVLVAPNYHQLGSFKWLVVSKNLPDSLE
jgi:hypothetical protein